MSQIIDKILEILKWPVALFLLFSLPALVKTIDYFDFKNLKHLVMFGGILMFFVSKTMMDSSVRTSIEVLAHEVTHAFWAMLTFHKVKGIRLNPDDSGGSMSFDGKGNWLIIISPYFFPLIGIITMITITVYQFFAPMNIFIHVVFGYVIGYHIDTVCSQIHEKQTDLPKVGYYFCVVFLPAANLWTLGNMIAFNTKGWDGVWAYNKLVMYLNGKNFDILLGYLS